MNNHLGTVRPDLLVSSIGRLELRDVQVISGTLSLCEAVQLLREHAVGAFPVVDEQGAMCGILSERDVVRYLAEVRCELSAQPSVASICTKEVQVVRTTDSIAYSLQLMGHGGFRHLPVVAKNSAGFEVPVSMLSVRDVIAFLVDQVEHP